MARAPELAQLMTARDFQQRHTADSGYAEFVKEYADEAFRMAVVVELDRPARKTFVVTQSVAATMAAAEDAPAFLKDDMRAVVQVLGGADEGVRDYLIEKECAGCRTTTPDFYVDRRSGKSYCPTCFLKTPRP